MFTGIIEAVGEIAALQPSGSDQRLRVQTGSLALADVRAGDSIAVSGVCLTVTELPGDGFWADVSGETLQRTILGTLSTGARVNLEKALLPHTRLGGHLVSGHVDGVGEITARRSDGRSVQFQVKAPDALARYIAEKGSICIDGVSLTVNAVRGSTFDLNIVPHTLKETIMDEYRRGRCVNLEVDLIARYLERLLLGERPAQTDTGISREFLASHGFARNE